MATFVLGLVTAIVGGIGFLLILIWRMGIDKDIVEAISKSSSNFETVFFWITISWIILLIAAIVGGCLFAVTFLFINKNKEKMAGDNEVSATSLTKLLDAL